MIAALSPFLPSRWIGIAAGVAMCLLACFSWTDCAAYTPSDEDRSNPLSLALQGVLLREGKENVQSIGRDEPPALSGARRGVSPRFKRRRDPDIRKPEKAWSTPEGAVSGDMFPRIGSDREEAGRSAEERAAQEIGLHGWSEDLRRYATLVFDRDQRVLADRLTREPAVFGSAMAISPFPPASTLPGGLRWPEPNSYEIWVAEILGL